MDRISLLSPYRVEVVDRLSKQVENAAQSLSADRDGDRPTRIHRLHAAHQAVRAGKRDAPDNVVAQHLGYLDRQVYVPTFIGYLDGT